MVQRSCISKTFSLTDPKTYYYKFESHSPLNGFFYLGNFNVIVPHEFTGDKLVFRYELLVSWS